MIWLKQHLIADCGRWWKLASVWLAGLAGTLSAVLIANQGLALSLINYLPTGWPRTLVAILIGALVFGVPTLTRLWQQKPHNG